MVLRKWLEGSRIVDICAVDGERVAWLTLETRNEIGDPVQVRLIVEIMGKHSNLILVDQEDRIIDGIRRYGSSLSRYREVLPGRAYLPPPPLTKLPLPPADEQNAGASPLYAKRRKSGRCPAAGSPRRLSPAGPASGLSRRLRSPGFRWSN